MRREGRIDHWVKWLFQINRNSRNNKTDSRKSFCFISWLTRKQIESIKLPEGSSWTDCVGHMESPYSLFLMNFHHNELIVGETIENERRAWLQWKIRANHRVLYGSVGTLWLIGLKNWILIEIVIWLKKNHVKLLLRFDKVFFANTRQKSRKVSLPYLSPLGVSCRQPKICFISHERSNKIWYSRANLQFKQKWWPSRADAKKFIRPNRRTKYRHDLACSNDKI